MRTFYKITLALTAMFISSASFGQATAQDDASTNLSVNLQDVYTIETGQNEVVIPMTTSIHFTDGSSSGEQEDHLRITATNNYTVDVQAASANLSNAGGDDIPVNNVQISVSGLGTSGSGEVAYVSNPLFLSDGAQEILGVVKGVLDRTYNVEYEIPANKTVNFLNRNEGIYKTVVTYTIMAE